MVQIEEMLTEEVLKRRHPSHEAWQVSDVTEGTVLDAATVC